MHTIPHAVQDIPLGEGSDFKDEMLGLTRYALALSQFIVQCGTPMTIAIQGDWGTGKCWALSFEKNQIYQQNLLFQKKGVIINPSLTEKRERNFKPFKPVNFQAGPNGEIYVLDWQGSIYRSS